LFRARRIETTVVSDIWSPMRAAHPNPLRRTLVQRFWTTARGFWSREAPGRARLLTAGLIVLVVLQIILQYRLNVWNRDIFNALEQKDGAAVLTQSLILLPLAAAIVGLAIIQTYGRMTTQRNWRGWLTGHLLDRWLANGRYYQLNLVTGDHQNPEGRIAEDARIATEAPVDFGVGILNSVATAATFTGVLWAVGGHLAIGSGDTSFVVPGYLVIAALAYSAIASTAMVLIAKRFIVAAEVKNQSEAEFRYALTRLRENGESIALLGGEREERGELQRSLAGVLNAWRDLCYQNMRSTLVWNANFVLASVVPLVLCAPKYLAGTMTLGELMQATAAFVQVQWALNWLIDNYPRVADWVASARRVGSLLVSLDHLDAAGRPGEAGVIRKLEHDGTALRLRDVSVTLDDGTVVINDADVTVDIGERILLVGESGTGKSTLVRAIAGLWPWGEGDISIQRGAKVFLMPQRPYIPLGSLRRVATYPLAPGAVADNALREALDLVGLGYLAERIDETVLWDHVLSGGEKQRLGFVRLLLHSPTIVIMDEATSALDPSSQERLMNLVTERLPHVTIVSIAHRPELEMFHQRKLVFQHKSGGSRLISQNIALHPNGLWSQLTAWLHRIVAPDRAGNSMPGTGAYRSQAHSEQ
jgi:putative ATP-binding cassette transporter